MKKLPDHQINKADGSFKAQSNRAYFILAAILTCVILTSHVSTVSAQGQSLHKTKQTPQTILQIALRQFITAPINMINSIGLARDETIFALKTRLARTFSDAGQVLSSVYPQGALAQNKNATPTSSEKFKADSKSNIFQRIWSFITAPFNYLFNNVNNRLALTQSTPKASPKPSPAPPPISDISQLPPTSTDSPSSTNTSSLSVTSLAAGTTYIDLIGKTIIDSFGVIFPSNDSLSQTKKPALGTSSNKFYGIFANGLELNTSGDFKVTGKLTLGESLNTVEINSNDWDISTGGNMTGIGSIGMDGTLTFNGVGTDITTGSNEHLNLSPDGTGNVGIAASAPFSRLMVVGRAASTGIAFHTQGTQNQGLTVLDNGNVGIGTTNPSATLIVRSGNVGIGGTSAGVALDVWGSGRFTSNLTVDGTLTTSGSLSSSSTFQAADGTVSAPAYSFTADTDTGLFRPGTDALGFTTGGSSRLTLTGAGFMGVGITSPAQIFQVNSGASSTVITSTGNLGIGITTANSALSVVGGAHIGSVRQGIVAPTDGLFVDGNVGVGATSTAYNLDIWGTGRFTGVLTVAGNLGVGTSLTVDSAAALTSLNVSAISNLVGNVGVGASINIAGLNYSQGGLRVNGLSDLTGNVGVGQSLTVSSTGAFTLSGQNCSTLTGGGKLTTNSSGNVFCSADSGSGITSASGATNQVTFWSAADTLSGNNAFYWNNPLLRLGIGSSAPGSTLGVFGSVGIGSSYGYGILPASLANGLAVQGNVAIGATAAGGSLVIVGGNVGIGTTSPRLPLEVFGTSGYAAAFTAGNVGIGTTAPAFTLDVSGNVGISQSLTVTSASALTTLNVSSISNLVGNVGVGASINIAGLNYSQGGLRVNGFSDLTGNVGIGGSLTVAGTLSSAGQITSIFGSATAPSFSFTGDTDTGIFRPSANALGFVTNAASRLTITEAGFLGIGITSPAQTFQVNSGASSTVINSSGNLGIGTTSPLSALSVVGGGVFGTGYGSLTAPTSGLLVEGRVGLGTTAPGAALGVSGAGLFGTFANLTGPANGLALSGNLGVGVTTANSNLAVSGNLALGAGFAGIAAPTNGLIVEGNTAIGISVPSQLFQVGSLGNALAFTLGGNLGVGITTPLNTLDVVGTTQLRGTGGVIGLAVTNDGRVGIGRTNPGSTLALAVQGNVGIGVTTANSTFAVSGNAVLGSGFAGMSAPTDGLLVQGNVGIATTATGFNTLQVTGSIGIGTTYARGNYELDVAGEVRARGYFGECSTDASQLGCNQDVAEIYDSVEDVSPGDLVAINLDNQTQVRKSKNAYDQNLIGIVSTSPGLLLGINGQDVALGGEANNYPLNADPRKPAVALSGKVPVKVVTENGPVEIGDYLTSSSISGVAMKATKAGPVVGQALSGYNGEGVGTVMAFVRLGYFNGVNLLDPNVLGVSTDSSYYSSLLLAKLLSERLTLAANTNLSNITTDRVTAGLEVITPQLTADTVLLRTLRPVRGGNLILALEKDQLFEVENDQKEKVISFDSLGNAYFKGKVVAQTVKADQIEGLRVLADELFTDKASSLVEFTKSLQASASSQLASTSTVIDTTYVRYNSSGGLTIGGASEFNAKSLFADIVEFISSVIFRGDVSFLGRATFNQDTAGLAVIKLGSDAVDIGFQRAYSQTPFVNVTLTTYQGNDGAANSILTGDVRYVVGNLSAAGFRIKLNKAAPADLTFSWTALAVNGHTVSTSSSLAQPPVVPSSSEPQVTPLPLASPTPQASNSAEPSPTPEVTPQPSPTPQPLPEATSSGQIQ